MTSEDGNTVTEGSVKKLNSVGEPEEELGIISISSGQYAEGWIGFEAVIVSNYTLNYKGVYNSIHIPFTIPKNKQKVDLKFSQPITEVLKDVE